MLSLVSSMAIAAISAMGMWFFRSNIRAAVASSFVYSAMTLLAFNVQQVYIIEKYEADIRYEMQCLLFYVLTIPLLQNTEKNETLIRILSSNSLNDVIITVLPLFCCQYSETSL